VAIEEDGTKWRNAGWENDVSETEFDSSNHCRAYSLTAEVIGVGSWKEPPVALDSMLEQQANHNAIPLFWNVTPQRQMPIAPESHHSSNATSSRFRQSAVRLQDYLHAACDNAPVACAPSPGSQGGTNVVYPNPGL
jgi:hypothetical protein